MGKHHDYEYENFTSAKRHKKKKHHHKHKHLKTEAIMEYDSDQLDVVNDIPVTPIRIVASVSDSPNASIEKMKAIPSPNKSTPASSKSNKKRKGKGRESGTSSDEERWLDAIESGKLEEVDDELKKIKDPKLMTARQRAMYERGNNDKEPSPGGELLMALPTGYREKEKVLTAEAIQKAQLKSLKRKQLADEKREKDKKKTMERLLKKQDTKQRSQGKNKLVKVAVPMITYFNSASGAAICLPPEHDFPLQAQKAKESNKPIICSIKGCHNVKSYNCSKTNVPLCSFACYKKNLVLAKEIIC